MARLDCVVAIICVALMCVIAEELYNDTFDNINVTEILQNDQQRSEYFYCVMGTAPCVTDAEKFFKGIAAEAFATKCKKCTEKQKTIFDTVADWYVKNEPENWQEFLKKVAKIGH